LTAARGLAPGKGERRECGFEVFGEEDLLGVGD